MTSPRFQFSIRWIFGVTAAIAVCIGLWTAEFPWSWGWGIVAIALSIAVPTMCGRACVQATGYFKAFWFGTTVAVILSTVGCFLIVAESMPLWFSGRELADDFAGTSVMFLCTAAESVRISLLAWACAPIAGIGFAALHDVLTCPQLRLRSLFIVTALTAVVCAFGPVVSWEPLPPEFHGWLVWCLFAPFVSFILAVAWGAADNVFCRRPAYRLVFLVLS